MFSRERYLPTRTAPSETYLIEVDAMLAGQPGKMKVLFFLTIWWGLGQWPPPIVK